MCVQGTLLTAAGGSAVPVSLAPGFLNQVIHALVYLSILLISSTVYHIHVICLFSSGVI